MTIAQHFSGAHLLLYSRDAESDRRFFREVLGLPSIDVGGGWLIFGMPAAELAVHPAEGEFSQSHAGEVMAGTVLYFMTPDVEACVAELRANEVACSAILEASWGRATTITLPSGARIGLYQPSHPSPPNASPGAA